MAAVVIKPTSRNIEHVAFNVADPVAVAAWYVGEIKTPDGGHLVMLRDLRSLPPQLCKRAAPLVRRA
jgi:hypothetical protein